MSILVDENTTFIIQGITGREAVNMTRVDLSVRPEPPEGRVEGHILGERRLSVSKPEHRPPTGHPR